MTTFSEEADSPGSGSDALQAAQSYLRMATRISRLGWWTIAVPGRQLTWSDETCVMHDAEPGHVPTLDEGISTFFPEHRALVKRHVELCAEQGVAYEFVLPKITLKGRHIWVRCHGEAVRDAAGTITRIQGAFQDITEQKQAEERTRQLETQLQATLESIADGFVLLDLEWRLAYVNTHAEAMLRQPRSAILGRKIWDAFPQVAGTDIEQQFRSAAETHETARFEARYPPGDTWFGIHFYPTPAGLAIHFQDITGRRVEQGRLAQLEADVARLKDHEVAERRKAHLDVLALNAQLESRVQQRTAELEIANKELMAANRELEAFSYSVSHDLRAPLSTINGFSRLLARVEADRLDEKSRHYLSRIEMGTKNMGELIEGLLSLAQLSRKKLHMEPVDLSGLVRQVVAPWKEQEQQRQVRIVVEEGLRATGDRVLLTAVLQNLLGNAWKFTVRREQAEIEFGSVQDGGGDPVYFVRDNGAGFDMAFYPKLFGTFERLHSPNDFAGTGIGLATVKRIVERHGGRVWADGRPGEGATFHFTLGKTA